MPKLPRLRHVRANKFLSQAELAEKAGVSRVTIIEIESGRADARWSTSRKIAAALGVEPGELVAPQAEAVTPDPNAAADARH